MRILVLKSHRATYITCRFVFVVAQDHFYAIKNFKTFLFYFHMFRRINSNLFELIHFNNNMKPKETKDQMCWFLQILFQYTQKNTASIMHA